MRAPGCSHVSCSWLISRLIPSHIRPLGYTQCSCLFPHINAFLSFLSPCLDENQLVAWERSVNFSPVLAAWIEEEEWWCCIGGGRVEFILRLLLKELAIIHNIGCGYVFGFLSRSEIGLCKKNYCFPFPLVSKWPHVPWKMETILQLQSSVCGKACFPYRTDFFALSSRMRSFFNPLMRTVKEDVFGSFSEVTSEALWKCSIAVETQNCIQSKIGPKWRFSTGNNMLPCLFCFCLSFN